MQQEATPNWHNDNTRPYWLAVAPRREELKQAIQDLAHQLNKFPVRA